MISFIHSSYIEGKLRKANWGESIQPSAVQLQKGLFQKKSKRGEWGGLRIYFFEKPLEFFIFFTLPLEIPDKTQLKPWIFRKIVLDLLEVRRPKTKTPGLEILHYFFLITLGNSTSFLINPCKFHMLFLWHPWKFHILKPPVWIFSGIAQEGEWMNEWFFYIPTHLATSLPVVK